MAKLRIELSASMDKLKAGLKKAKGTLEQWRNRVAKVGKIALGVGAGALAAGLAAAAKRSIQLAASFQQTTVAFNTMVGDSQKAAALIDALTEFSTKTPFTPEQVQKAAKTLLAFGFAADDVKGTLKILGDVSAGTGKDLSELAVIFGQIKSAGRLMGQDLLQLINAGFNPLQVMSEKTGKSMAQLKDEMSKGLITFEDVRQAFEDATNAGGLFFNMMEQQSGTVAGKLSTLQGNWDEFLKTLGQGTTGPIANLLDKLNDMVGALDDIAKSQDAATEGAKGMGLLFEEWAKQVGTLIPGMKQLLELGEKMGVFEQDVSLAAPKAGEKATAEKAKRDAEKAEADAKREAAEKKRIAGEMAFGEGFGGQAIDLAELKRRVIEKARREVQKQQEKEGRDRAKQGLKDAISASRKRAAELEKSINTAFRPQGEIASNLARIGGEAGISLGRNVPEKQLQELKGINNGIKVLEEQLKNLNKPSTFP